MISNINVPKKEKEKEDIYPCLKTYKGGVVLFRRKNTGVLVHPPKEGKIYPLGDYSTEWEEDKFKPFKGEVILEN